MDAFCQHPSEMTTPCLCYSAFSLLVWCLACRNGPKAKLDDCNYYPKHDYCSADISCKPHHSANYWIARNYARYPGGETLKNFFAAIDSLEEFIENKQLREQHIEDLRLDGIPHHMYRKDGQLFKIVLLILKIQI
jgi:hypothetical protein